MSISFANKLKLIRTAIGKDQQVFAQLIDVADQQYATYESGQRDVCAQVLKKICSHPECVRYTLWLMTDQTNAAAGQIAPGDPSPLQLTAINQSEESCFDYQFMQTTEQALQLFCQLDWFLPNENITNFNDCSRLLLKDLKAVIELHYNAKEDDSP